MSGWQQILIPDKKALKLLIFDHRGARLITQDACGSSLRFTCPYHAWTFSPTGELVVFIQRRVGDLGKDYGHRTALFRTNRTNLGYIDTDPSSISSISLDVTVCSEFGFDRASIRKPKSEGPNGKVV